MILPIDQAVFLSSTFWHQPSAPSPKHLTFIDEPLSSCCSSSCEVSMPRAPLNQHIPGRKPNQSCRWLPVWACIFTFQVEGLTAACCCSSSVDSFKRTSSGGIVTDSKMATILIYFSIKQLKRHLLSTHLCVNNLYSSALNSILMYLLLYIPQSGRKSHIINHRGSIILWFSCQYWWTIPSCVVQESAYMLSAARGSY